MSPRVWRFLNRRDECQIEVTRKKRVPVGEDDRAFDAVLQFADIARPSIGLECVQGRGRQRDRLLLEIAAKPIDEVARKKRNIVAALPKWRHGDREHRQSEEEVLSKSARGDRRTKAPIRRRDKPDINRDERGASDPFEAALLQRTQNLRLQCKRQVSYFVQEQRARCAISNLPGFRDTAPVNAPFS